MNDEDTKILISVMKDRDVAYEEWQKCENLWKVFIEDNLVIETIKENAQNKELRKQIVDLADLWDGKESSHYGNSLQELLINLGIRDVPDFYKKKNIDKFIKEMRNEKMP